MTNGKLLRRDSAGACLVNPGRGSSRRARRRQNRPLVMQQFLKRLPDPQGHRSLRPSFSSSTFVPCTTRSPRLTFASEGYPPPPLARALESSGGRPSLGTYSWRTSLVHPRVGPRGARRSTMVLVPFKLAGPDRQRRLAWRSRIQRVTGSAISSFASRARRSAGKGASSTSGSRVTGWVSASRAACRAWRASSGARVVSPLP